MLAEERPEPRNRSVRVQFRWRRLHLDLVAVKSAPSGERGVVCVELARRLTALLFTLVT